MILRFADVSLDTDRQRLARAGEEVAVEPQVFDLIRLLAENPGRLVSYDEILAQVWGGRIVSDGAISARVAAARKAVGDDGKRQSVIRTIAKRGLELAVDVEVSGSRQDAPAASERPRIRYTDDGAGNAIAWALTGSGPPLLKLGWISTHVESDWQVPSERALIEGLAEVATVARYDPVGFGMSAAPLAEVDLDDVARNGLAVADAAGFAEFAVMSQSGGSLAAVRLAAMAPGRVTRLVISGGYAEGLARRDTGGLHPGTFDPMIEQGWQNPATGLAAALLLTYFPEGPLADVQAMAGAFAASATPENELAIRRAINSDSVMHLLGQVSCETLILHGRRDAVHPLAQAQKLAAGIARSELVVLDTANHEPLSGQAIWPGYMDTIRAFLSG